MDYLVAFMVQLCPEKAYSPNGLRTMNACQEQLLNCAVGSHGEIEKPTVDKCVEKLKDEKSK